MRKFLFFIFVILFTKIFSQGNIVGKVVSESLVPLGSVLVVNTNSGLQINTDIEGNFSIKANVNDELRFVKNNYERKILIATSDKFTYENQVVMQQIPALIEEVEIMYKVTGDLRKDSKALTKIDKVEQLQREIGVPKPVEKPREKPAEVKQVLLPVLLGQLNVQGLYDLISGKSRRQKSLYKYEDFRDNISWIRKRLDDDYFTKANLPQDKISEFLQFSMLYKPEIASYIRANNLSKVMFILEQTMPIYLEKLKK